MAESLEAFVKKLQTEGVDAGKQAAEKIKKRAEHEAEKILVNAEKEAEKIIAEAKNSAEKELSRAQTELELAVRDTILKRQTEKPEKIIIEKIKQFKNLPTIK